MARLSGLLQLLFHMGGFVGLPCCFLAGIIVIDLYCIKPCSPFKWRQVWFITSILNLIFDIIVCCRLDEHMHVPYCKGANCQIVIRVKTLA